MEEARKEENQQVIKVLEALKQASLDLQTNPNSIKSPDSISSSSPIKALLELETEADNILSNDPNLRNLSTHLSSLKILIENLNQLQGHSIRSFVNRRVNSHEIARVASLIVGDIQAWIDREMVENLVKSLQDSSNSMFEDEEKVNLLTQFESRVLQGFNRELQDSVLKSKVFNVLESVLCNPKCSKRVREQSGFAISALVRFNKDVFVGEVLMGETVRALISISSASSIHILCSLIKSIKSPLVDEIESNNEIPKIINFLTFDDFSLKVVALNCVLEIGYRGRKDAIEAMLVEGLVEKLVELQRSELGGDLIEMGRLEERSGGIRVDEIDCKPRKEHSEEMKFLESHPFASCVARFAIQLEVGEGLRQREKRAFKQEILRRVRVACVSDAEAATIVAEVLWGASP